MRDDRIQGILFSRTDTIDLKPRKKTARMFENILTKKQTIKNFRGKLHISSRRNNETEHFVVTKKDRREQQLSDLAGRFKTRG